MTRFILLLAYTFCGTLSLLAQNTRRVSASYIYYAPENMSVEEAKRTALDRAKIQAIADVFGTVVAQSTTTVVANNNGESESRFFSIGGSDVKGEWIETLQDPEFDITFKEHLLVVRCTVIGKAREIITPNINFVAKPLRNGTEKKFESYEFRDGDYLYLFFQSAVDGYLMVYLIDESNEMAYVALPYRNSDNSPKYVRADMEYILFSQKDSELLERRYVDEYKITCENEIEYNDFYILFSEEPFSKMMFHSDNGLDLPKMVDLGDFQRWLAKLRIRNHKLMLSKIPIKITKSNTEK